MQISDRGKYFLGAGMAVISLAILFGLIVTESSGWKVYVAMGLLVVSAASGATMATRAIGNARANKFKRPR